MSAEFSFKSHILSFLLDHPDGGMPFDLLKYLQTHFEGDILGELNSTIKDLHSRSILYKENGRWYLTEQARHQMEASFGESCSCGS